MSCCGHRPLRADGAGGGTVHGSPAMAAGSAAASSASSAMSAMSAMSASNADNAGTRASQPEFRYTGATTLTVTGPVTGRTYRFAAPGARLQVNWHDAASLLYVPSLQPVRR